MNLRDHQEMLETRATETRPLIAHIIHHLVTGGLENGLINLINRLPEGRYRHAVICMTDYSDFRFRIHRRGVEIFAMHKRAGHDPLTQWRLMRLLRRLRPAILHSRNLTALDSLLPAAIAGVKVRIHGEHGRDEKDPDGSSRRMIWLRRAHSPLVSHYVTVSDDLSRYLIDKVGIAPSRVSRLYNGVDVERFRPATSAARHAYPAAFQAPGLLVVGYVGRLEPVKDPCTLIRAFGVLAERAGSLRRSVRLAIIGDGALRPQTQQLVRELGIEQEVWFAGNRDDIPELMRGMDLFVLSSIGEGISNTILEAMATGLPIVATGVGGNVELVEDGRTGFLVPRGDPGAMADVLLRYLRENGLRASHGRAARDRAVRRFSLATMTQNYSDLYQRMLASRGNS